MAAVGVEDLAVVETSDAVLVARKDRDQDVKQLVEVLKAQNRPEYARSSEGSPALGQLPDTGDRGPLPGEAPHHQTRCIDIVADPRASVGALGCGEGCGHGHPR